MRPALRIALAVPLLFVSLSFGAHPARAQDAATAKEHYQRGTSDYDLGRYADAIKEFEAAYELKNDPAFLFNLAQSHRLAGNVDQALHFYKTYLRYVPKAPNRADIESRIAQLEELAAQKNAAQTAPPTQTLAPGGTASPETAPPATAPVVTPPSPGPSSTPPGAPPPADGTPGPSMTATATAPAGPGGAPMLTTTPTPSPGAGQSLRRGGVYTAVGGGALIVIGAIYGGLAVGAANDVNNTAKQMGTFDPSVESRGKRDETAEKVFLGLGFVAGAVGGVLYFLGYRQQESTVSVTPVASSNGAGASLRVIF